MPLMESKKLYQISRSWIKSHIDILSIIGDFQLASGYLTAKDMFRMPIEKLTNLLTN